MFSFIKKHLYLFGFGFFLLGIGAAVLGYYGVIKSKIALAVFMLIPIGAGLLFFFAGRIAAEHKEQEEQLAALRKVRRAESGAKKNETVTPPRPYRVIRTFYDPEVHMISSIMFDGKQPDELIEEDHRDAAAAAGKTELRKETVITSEGWNVFVQTPMLILCPELFSSPAEINGVLPVTEPEPAVTLFADGEKVAEYRLETEDGEDFTGKYFHFSARVSIQGRPAAPAVQMDGFVSDSDDPDLRMTLSDIGYRMEVAFVGGRIAALRRRLIRGRDVEYKALRYPGIITPGNVRYLGMCQVCGRSFMFHSYNFPHMGQIPVYSDDGLDVCGLPQSVDFKDGWEGVINGVHFSSRNSFCCPRCRAPYVYYEKYPEMLHYGTYACCHRGHKVVEFEPAD